LDPIFITNPRRSKRVKKEKESETEEEVEAPIYQVEDHLEGKSENTKALFEHLQERIMDLADDNSIVEKSNKMYVSYKHGKNFCEVRVQSKALWIWLDIHQSDLNDPYQLTRDVSNIGHYGTGFVDLKLMSLTDIEKVMHLIEQSFRQTM